LFGVLDRDMTPSRILSSVALVVAGLIGALIGLRLARRRAERRIARHRRTGRAGAERALRLLRRAGYRVLDTEVTATGTVVVDGERREYRVRADALVRRWFRSYVAEFKGGPESARLENRDTRRQLLEYATVFDAKGILLVDADAGRIRRVRFPRPTR
jgi:hypothetical protein